MSAGSSADPQAAQPRPPVGASPEGSQRSATWVTWTFGWSLVGVFVIYPLSIMPAYVAMLMLQRHGINVFPAYRFCYWPIIWLLDNVELFKRLDNVIEPVLRGLVR